jgi:hypothetical protein
MADDRGGASPVVVQSGMWEGEVAGSGSGREWEWEGEGEGSIQPIVESCIAERKVKEATRTLICTHPGKLTRLCSHTHGRARTNTHMCRY